MTNQDMYAEFNAERKARRRAYAADELKRARLYTTMAADAETADARVIYLELVANCYKAAYKWKSKSEVPLFKEWML